MNGQDEADPRGAAIKRIEKKRNAWRFLLLWVALAIFFTAIWAISGGGYFWPVWPALGIGIGVGVTFIDAYAGSRGPTEDQIEREMRRGR